MNAQKPSLQVRVTARSWRMAAIGFVLLYCPLLALVFATTSFSEEDATRQYIVQISNRPPAPLPPLPAAHFIEWPDIALHGDRLQEDPFQQDPSHPLATSMKQASLKPASPTSAAGTPTAQPFRFVASYQELGQAYVIGRGATGELTRFRVGDEADGGVIERIDARRVILNSDGHQRMVDILRVEPEALRASSSERGN